MSGTNLSPYCAQYHQAVQVIGQRWVPEIVRAMLAGRSRFSQLTSVIPGLSDRLLSERLRTLEAAGVITRTVIPETPVRVEYCLTEKGRGLARVVRELATWAERWVPSDTAGAAIEAASG